MLDPPSLATGEETDNATLLVSLSDQLEAKTRDLVLAAEIGNSLLQQNNDLKTQLEDARLRIQELEQASNHEQQELSRQRDEHGQLLMQLSLRQHHQQQQQGVRQHTCEERELSGIEMSGYCGQFCGDPNSVDDSSQPLQHQSTRHRTVKKEAETRAYIANLESAKAELSVRVDELTNALEASERAHDKRFRTLTTENESLKIERNLLASTIRELEDVNATLDRDKAELASKLRVLNLDNSKKQEKLSHEGKLELKCAELEEIIFTVAETKAQLEEHMSFLMHENDQLKEEALKLKMQVVELQDVQTQCACLEQERDDLLAALEDERALVTDIKSRLTSLEPFQGEVAHGSKSLLGEVEDRRLELENKHQHLAQKHAGLWKAHSETLHQQERLKNHISRLSQLSHQKGSSSEDRIRALENALDQLQSENQELCRKLMIFEKHGGATLALVGNIDSLSSITGDSERPLPSAQAIELLRLNVESLSQEANRLRKELRTAQMLKLAESEKLSGLQAELHETKRETERLNIFVAELKYENGELRAAAHQKHTYNDNTVADQIVQNISIGTQTMLSTFEVNENLDSVSTLIRQLSPARLKNISQPHAGAARVIPAESAKLEKRDAHSTFSDLSTSAGTMSVLSSSLKPTMMLEGTTVAPVAPAAEFATAPLTDRSPTEKSETQPIAIGYQSNEARTSVALEVPVYSDPKVRQLSTLEVQDNVGVEDTVEQPTEGKNVIIKRGEAIPGECNPQ